MPNMNVTYDDMRTAADRLGAGQAEIEAKLSELKSLIDNLVATGYVTDTSSKAFDASYSEFNTGVVKTVQGLQGMGDYLKTAARTLEDTDRQLASGVQS